MDISMEGWKMDIFIYLIIKDVIFVLYFKNE